MLQEVLNLSLHEVDQSSGPIALFKNSLFKGVFLLSEIEEHPNDFGSLENGEHFIIENFISAFK